MTHHDHLPGPRPLIPRKPVPSLELDTVGGSRWRLADQDPDNFTLLVFYRGLHCPICKTYLAQLHKLLGDFSERGVDAIAISSDTADRAQKTKAEWEIPNLTIAYGLELEKAREWGLYVSSAISDKEPDRFSEPALYMVRPDGTLYFSAVQSMPFARPDFRTLLPAIDFVLKEDYPARGEVLDEAAVTAG
jgi:peroxiredoxin